ncbi:MAG: PilZ domain-containing protein, partial [Candidatus Omnitrophica bacterium]|nr:PilZ domain-containing protein [Candidatus Omnitrophota bacterium]
MLRKEHNETNRRKYLRLDSTFPVQFRLVSLDGKHFLSQWLMGFTNNVSKGGICLEVANLNKELLEFFKSGQVKLSVDIELPIFRRPVAATTSIAWIKEVADQPSRYCIGLHYDVIDSLQNAQIMRYAWMKKLFVPVTFGIIAFCIAAFAFNFLVNNRLAASNKLLVRQLVKTLNETDIVKRKASDIAQEKDALQSKLAYLEKQIVVAEKERQGKRGDSAPAAAHGSLGPLGVLQQEKKILQDKLAFVQQQEAVVASEMRRLGKRKSALEKANFDKMLVWLKTHQNPRTGLVVSFEGDNDLSRWAFTYDQALAVIAFSRFGDLERAKKILLFYQNKAKRMDGKLLNAYYVDDGVPAEFMVHNGPNIWMAIAALHYTKRSNDTRFLGMAEQIAQSVMKMQEQDKDGGIRGGPNVPWYATEHNL